MFKFALLLLQFTNLLKITISSFTKKLLAVSCWVLAKYVIDYLLCMSSPWSLNIHCILETAVLAFVRCNSWFNWSCGGIHSIVVFLVCRMMSPGTRIVGITWKANSWHSRKDVCLSVLIMCTSFWLYGSIVLVLLRQIIVFSTVHLAILT
jgi:hypothetical protein